MKSRRRKQYIDKAVQGALIKRIILHWLFFFTVAFFVLPFWKLLSTGDFSRPFTELMLRSWAETASLLVVLVAMIPIFVWDTVTLSNRFAGPVYRFHNAIKSLAEDFNVMVEYFKAEQGDEPDAEPADEPDAEPVQCG